MAGALAAILDHEDLRNLTQQSNNTEVLICSSDKFLVPLVPGNAQAHKTGPHANRDKGPCPDEVYSIRGGGSNA